ncbi:uncharacterized protein LOC128740053 [Sabethes cyaneus]|uniref:uncharacterized protein LOC128740053 n=1 Tax=Sabethes cyaneus TaxID=53552 RepID=UPI00237D5C8C|nr:uncharacterized protein LOC128740053 [Sabethes cyaneus]
MFRIIPVELHSGEKRFTVLAFLDEGASVTLIEEKLADRLGIFGVEEKLTIKWTTDVSRVEKNSRKLSLRASAVGSSDKILLRTVRTVGQLMLPRQKLDVGDLATQYPYMRGLPIASYDGHPEILIGLNNIHSFAPLEVRMGSTVEPIAVRCRLGWTAYGPKLLDPAGGYVFFHQQISNEDIHDLLKQHYALEESVVAKTAESAEDKRAREIMERTTKRVGERFETGLLWKSDSIEEYQQKGYAHVATKKELTETDPSKTWYLPINAVLNPKKPGKVRLVWDAAATVQGVSLNSQLLKGPDLLVPLVTVLIGFREKRIAIGGDLREMFHQLKIIRSDRQAQRFLFRFNPEDEPIVYVMDVATFGATCSPSSAQYVKNINAEEYAERYPEAAAAIIQRHYVDDYFDSVDTIDEAVERAKQVAPLKRQSIPRLELMAALLGARMNQTIVGTHSLHITRCTFWTDSRTVCSWLQSDQYKFKQFVAFRVGEVLELTRVGDWRWISTKQNVADMLTKWGRGPTLQSEGEWFRGPSFLYLPENQWPSAEIPSEETSEDIRGVVLFHEVLEVETISTWKRLLRVAATVLRFVHNCRRKRKGLAILVAKATIKQQQLLKMRYKTSIEPLRQEELAEAEFLWKQAQWDSFPDEMSVLTKNLQLKPGQKAERIAKNSYIYKCSPALDPDGVLRVDSRLAKAENIPLAQRYPVILSRFHNVTKKILQDYHEKFGHANGETVFNEMRKKFEIPNLRTAIQQVARECVWCRVHRCIPRAPRMAPLPVQRVSAGRRPFSAVGVDYLGPVEVTVGRRKEKRWVAVFTCLAVRAVHLEVVHTLSTQSCLLALRRFCSRYGEPEEIFSDNGTCFRGAWNEIQKTKKQINRECAEQMISPSTAWYFNPPGTPHMGGIWERMVRSVKEAMRALHDGKKLTDEILNTTVAEVADMINLRRVGRRGSYYSEPLSSWNSD